mgnify:CR=1 FL=1
MCETSDANTLVFEEMGGWFLSGGGDTNDVMNYIESYINTKQRVRHDFVPFIR